MTNDFVHVNFIVRGTEGSRNGRKNEVKNSVEGPDRSATEIGKLKQSKELGILEL